MSLHELFLLQGMDPHVFKKETDSKLIGQLIGNAMRVNVVERILVKALQASNLAPSTLKDRWATGNPLAEMQRPRKDTLQKDDSNVRLKFVASGPHLNKTRVLIVDSGASFHMVDKKSLSHKEKKQMRKIAHPLLLSTANGLVWATWETCIYIHELEIEVWVILLENTPAVLSLGKLITQNGFNYTWNHGEVPILHKDNLKVHCYPSNDVPFITNCVTKRDPEQPTPSTVDP